MSTGNYTTVYAGKKVVGQVQNGVFTKPVRESKHLLRSPRAWAFDIQSLNDAERAGAMKVELQDAETGLVYSAAITQIRAKGIIVDRGFGEQVALPLHLWRVEQRGVKQLEMAL